jgi:hypothetical protein
VAITEIAVANFSMARLSGNEYSIELLSHNDGCNLQDDRITAGQIIRHGMRKGVFSEKKASTTYDRYSSVWEKTSCT